MEINNHSKFENSLLLESARDAKTAYTGQKQEFSEFILDTETLQQRKSQISCLADPGNTQNQRYSNQTIKLFF